jgi:hypothetical protein
MTGVPAPFIAPSRNKRAWETLVVRYGELDWPAPGIVTITGADIEIDYDVKEAQAQKSASTERKGEKVKKFTSTHWLSNAPLPEGSATAPPGVIVDDHYQWTAFRWVLDQSKDASPPQALSVSHPVLTIQGIRAAVVTKIGQPTANADGSTVIAIDWLEYKEPVRTGGGGAGADPDESPDGRTETDDKIDKAIEEIDKLQKEWEDL